MHLNFINDTVVILVIYFFVKNFLKKKFKKLTHHLHNLIDNCQHRTYKD